MLRLWNLGYLNFWGDESITALAVKGIFAHGYPQMPSGMIYFRSLLTTYLSALAAIFLGVNEMTLRLPSVLFNLGTILVVYQLGKVVFSQKVGLAAALVLTFSSWELEFARHARMYAPFAFFYTLSLYAIYRGVIEGARRWFGLSILISVGTVLIHELGATVALLYLAFATRPSLHKLSRGRLLGVATFLIVLAIAQFYLVQFGFAIPAILNEKTTVPSFTWIGRTFLENFSLLPSLELLLSSWPWSLLPGSVVVLLLGYFFRQESQKKLWRWLVPVSILVVLVMHQIVLAGLILCFYLLFSEKSHHDESRPEIRATVILVLLLFVFWTAYGLFFWTAGDGSSISLANRFREVIKIEAGLPKLYYLCFFSAYPLMACIAGIGLVRLFHLSTHPHRQAKAFLIFTGFVIPLLINGFLKTDWLEYRLNFHLNPLFALIYVFAWRELLRVIWPWLKLRLARKAWRMATAAAIGVVLAASCEQIYPLHDYHLIARNYGDPVDPRSAPGSHFRLMPDHQMPAEYVKRQRREGDIVIAMDWLAQHYYLGRIDYWLRADAFAGKSYRREQNYFDLYTGTQVVATVEDLQKIIAKQVERRIWIITASPYTETQLHVTNEMLNFLKTLGQYVVFRGRDGKSLVYLLSEQTQCTAISDWEYRDHAGNYGPRCRSRGIQTYRNGRSSPAFTENGSIKN